METVYWIIDYLGLDGRRYIGNAKQPTITVCNLIEDEYQLQLFEEWMGEVIRNLPPPEEIANPKELAQLFFGEHF